MGKCKPSILYSLGFTILPGPFPRSYFPWSFAFETMQTSCLQKSKAPEFKNFPCVGSVG